MPFTVSNLLIIIIAEGGYESRRKNPGSVFEAIVPYLSPEKGEMFDSFSEYGK